MKDENEEQKNQQSRYLPFVFRITREQTMALFGAMKKKLYFQEHSSPLDKHQSDDFIAVRLLFSKNISFIPKIVLFNGRICSNDVLMAQKSDESLMKHRRY